MTKDDKKALDDLMPVILAILPLIKKPRPDSQKSERGNA